MSNGWEKRSSHYFISFLHFFNSGDICANSHNFLSIVYFLSFNLYVLKWIFRLEYCVYFWLILLSQNIDHIIPKVFFLGLLKISLLWVWAWWYTNFSIHRFKIFKCGLFIINWSLCLNCYSFIVQKFANAIFNDTVIIGCLILKVLWNSNHLDHFLICKSYLFILNIDKNNSIRYLIKSISK